MGIDLADDVLSQIHRLFHEGTVTGLSDRELLERFVARRDEVAFAALVARHGRMVLAVCRSVLKDSHDWEDAFQATFLVLARKVRSLWVKDSLGPWLYRISLRIAQQAKADAARRRRRERRFAETRMMTSCEIPESDLLPLLYAEVDRLPEKYRTTVVLCHVEGMTHEAAARVLRCPVGTVHGRLSRAREMLRCRLRRRGLDFPAGSLVAAMTHEAPAAIPTSLADATIRASMSLLAGEGLTSGVTSGAVIALMARMLRTMTMSKLRAVGAVALAVGGIASGVGWFAQAAPTGPLGMQGSAVAESQSKPAAPKAKDAPTTDVAKLQGTWRLIRVTEGGEEQEKGGLVVGEKWPVPSLEVPGVPSHPIGNYNRSTLTDTIVLVPDGLTERIAWIFAEDRLTLMGDHQKVLASYRLKEAEDPRQIDIVVARPYGDGNTLSGIYSLEGDILKVCFDYPLPNGRRRARPKSFEAKAGTWQTIYTLRRKGGK